MADNLFSLEALQANEGDCLILHCGGTPKDKHRIILIDCGPAKIYSGFLKKRLLKIKADISPLDPLPIDLLMISHIDDDHITGAVDMTDELIDLGETTPPFDMTQIWFNSFDDLTGSFQDEFAASLGELAASALSTGDLSLIPGLDREGMAVIASLGKGQKLRDNAKKLDLFVNPGFKRLVTPPKTKKFGDLSLTVLAPDNERLKKFQAKWDAEIKKIREAAKKKGKVDPADLAGIALLAKDQDTSPTNLASITVLAKCQGKTMLLTGDALGTHVVDGLENSGNLTDGKIHVDILKMPHHGSARNINEDFFKAITATNYLFSADGLHGNPDIRTLELLTQSRPKEDLNLFFTNEDGEDKKTGFKLKPALDKFFKGEKDRKRKHNVVFRDASKDGKAAPATLIINLLDPLP